MNRAGACGGGPRPRAPAERPVYAAGAGGARVREARDPIADAPRNVCGMRARAEPAVGGGGASLRGRPAAAGSGTGRGAMRPGWSMEMRIAQHVRARASRVA